MFPLYAFQPVCLVVAAAAAWGWNDEVPTRAVAVSAADVAE